MVRVARVPKLGPAFKHFGTCPSPTSLALSAVCRGLSVYTVYGRKELAVAEWMYQLEGDKNGAQASSPTFLFFWPIHIPHLA